MGTLRQFVSLRGSAFVRRFSITIEAYPFVDDAEVDELIFRWIANDADRFESLLYAFDLLFEKLT